MSRPSPRPQPQKPQPQDQSEPQQPSTAPLETRKAPRIGRSFSSRNPTPIGAIGLVFLLVLLIAAFNAAKLPLIGGGTNYSAYFTEAANLKVGDEVRIAGIKVGTVESVSIHDPVPGKCPSPGCIKATFTVKNGYVGDRSTVDIKLKTLLGAKYLNINSAGGKSQKSGTTIPVGRTTTPFDIYPAFTQLSRTIDKINTVDLADSFKSLAQAFQGTPAEVRPVVTGLARLSNTIASRDQKLRDLLTAANSVTGVLAQRDQDLQRLISDGNLLLQELNARRDAIHALFVNTQVLATQLRGLVNDNRKTIGPLLTSLDKVLTLLNNNQENLDRGLSLLGPFYRVFNNVIGNGRWFDNYIQNLSVCGILALALHLSTC
ncbi:MAG TPA: MCE family protein [Jatrophihabitantaceae bacterium]|nr:MCE family protein [Jatrophihabitantaceae bacterium]